MTSSKVRVKRFLVRCGARFPGPVVVGFNAIANYLTVGSWLDEHGLAVRETVGTREEVYGQMAALATGQAVHYMEFGVADGEALRYWSALLDDPRSRLHGFDSFEGLPASWLGSHPAGHFSRGGTLPEVDDARVTFFKGWFEDTLPGYDWSQVAGDRLILNMDADMYSSTDQVLRAAEPHIVPGTIIYFDEFNHQADELRAFAEYLERNPHVRFETVAATHDRVHIAFIRAS